jgi:hypothetical protein
MVNTPQPLRQRRPKRRTWTLATLPRDVTYILWYDAAANRWEVAAAGTDRPLRTVPDL